MASSDAAQSRPLRDATKGQLSSVRIMAMTIHDVFPLEALRSSYHGPLSVERFGMDKINEVIVREHDRMFSLALHIWNRMLQDEQFSHFDPQFIAPKMNGPL